VTEAIVTPPSASGTRKEVHWLNADGVCALLTEPAGLVGSSKSSTLAGNRKKIVLTGRTFHVLGFLIALYSHYRVEILRTLFVQQPCTNPSKSPERLRKKPTQKCSDFQQFCKFWKLLENYLGSVCKS
jgi:hypothetical protein